MRLTCLGGGVVEAFLSITHLLRLVSGDNAKG